MPRGMRHNAVVFVLLCSATPFLLRADDKPVAVADKPASAVPAKRDLTSLAARADAVVLARAGQISPRPEATGGTVALWVEHDFKGPLHGGRDIIWLPRNELPKAEVGAALWLLCLEQNGDGSWKALTGEGTPSIVDGPGAPAAKKAAEGAALFSPRKGSGPDNGELSLWVKKAGKGSAKARREAFANLLSAGPAARAHLESAEGSTDPEIANTARRLLQLVNGGGAANGISLALEPARTILTDDGKQYLTVHYANQTDREIRVVLGTSAWGENVAAATAYDVRKIDGEKDAPKVFLKATLPESYGKALQDGATPLPLTRVAPIFGTYPVQVEVQVVKVEVGGVVKRRLQFGYGYVDLPGDGLGRFALRVNFECAGPRPDQKSLIDANFWQGGRLVSNEVILTVRQTTE